MKVPCESLVQPNSLNNPKDDGIEANCQNIESNET